MASLLKVPARGIKSSICLWFDRQDKNGNKTGFCRLRNPTEFSLNPQTDQTVIRGTECDNFGQELDAVTEITGFDLGLNFSRVDAFSLAIGNLGSYSSNTVVAEQGLIACAAAFKCKSECTQRAIDEASLAFPGADLTVADGSQFEVGELITSVEPGQEGLIGYVSVIAGNTLSVLLACNQDTTLNGVLDTLDAGTTFPLAVSGANGGASTASASVVNDTILTVDTDYEFIQAQGRIDFGDTDLIPNGCIQYRYDHTGYECDQVDLLTQTIIKGRLCAKGIDQGTGYAFDILLHRVSLAPNGASNWLGDNRLEVPVTGKIETPEGFNSPGYIRMYNQSFLSDC